MILVGSQRGGARNLALHLMKDENDHVNVHEVRGFASDDLMGALNEAYAMSRGTKSEKFLYSLSLNPPEKESVPVKHFESAIDQAEQRLGLNGQPRAIVFHEKEGRRHAHAVWSRIDTENMKAVHIAYDHKKLKTLSRDLFLEHGWKMPRGLTDSRESDPRNFTLADWQQAKRSGKDPRAVKAAIQDAWAISDSRESFGHALQERGFVLARGDRRGHVAVDLAGEVRAIARQAGVKTKDVRARLGDENFLPTVDEAKDQISRKVLPTLQRFQDQLEQQKQAQVSNLKEKKQALINSQRASRQDFFKNLEARCQKEVNERQDRFRKGLGGAWDRLRGEHKKIYQRNEVEAAQALQRDQHEKEAFIQKQLTQRREFTGQVRNTKRVYLEKRQALQKDIKTYEQLRSSPKPDPVMQPDQKGEYLRKRQSSRKEREPIARTQTPSPLTRAPTRQADAKAAHLEKRKSQTAPSPTQDRQPPKPTPER